VSGVPKTIGAAELRRFKRYPAYKDSGVEWLGKIPSHWQVKRLMNISSVQLSNVDKKSAAGEQPVRLCNYVNVYYNERITANLDFMTATATPEQIRRFLLRAGDVLITKDSESWTDIAVPAVVAEDLPGVLCGYHLAHIRPSAGSHGPFLARAFSAIGPRDQFQISANGITRFGLGGEAIRTGLFAIPPEFEQHAIATFLDLETAKIDALVGKKERVIELLHEKRTSLITHAVTKGLDPKARMKDSGIEWVGQIPAHWEIKPLRWALSVRSGEALSNTEFELASSEDHVVPVIGGNGTMGYGDRSNTSVPSIAIGRVAALCGNVHLVNPPAWVTDNALLVSEIKGFAREYLALLLKALNLNRWASQNAQPLITGGFVKAQLVCCPPLPEQQNIVDRVRKETTDIDTLIERVRSAMGQLKEMRTAFISAAVMGKIDLREEAA
jgi:type I restriction enzyme S subunit